MKRFLNFVSRLLFIIAVVAAVAVAFILLGILVVRVDNLATQVAALSTRVHGFEEGGAPSRTPTRTPRPTITPSPTPTGPTHTPGPDADAHPHSDLHAGAHPLLHRQQRLGQCQNGARPRIPDHRCHPQGRAARHRRPQLLRRLAGVLLRERATRLDLHASRGRKRRSDCNSDSECHPNRLAVAHTYTHQHSDTNPRV